MKLLNEKEQMEVEKTKKEMEIKEYTKRVHENLEYINTVKEKISLIEINCDTDFADVYTYLAEVNNYLLTILGDIPPEGWPKLNNMPMDSLSFNNGFKSPSIILKFVLKYFNCSNYL